MKIRLNNDIEKVKEIQRLLKENDGYCPCRLIKNEDTKCMCKDFKIQFQNKQLGLCHCELYEIVSEDK